MSSNTENDISVNLESYQHQEFIKLLLLRNKLTFFISDAKWVKFPRIITLQVDLDILQ